MFTTQDIQLARVFARAAAAWLDRGDPDAVEDAADLLLDGSAQYVKVVINAVVVLEKKQPGSSTSPPDLADINDAASETNPWHRLRKDGLDVAVPIELTALRTPDKGVIQVGFSDAQVHARVAQHRRLVLLTAGGGWLSLALIVVLVQWLLVLRRGAARGQRGESPPDGIVRRGDLVLDTESCEVRWKGQSVDLTPKTHDLLLFLARNPGKTYSDADLLDTLWADAPYAASNDVKQCIYLLRQRLGAVCEDPKSIIVNVKGFGYRLETPDDAALNEN